MFPAVEEMQVLAGSSPIDARAYWDSYVGAILRYATATTGGRRNLDQIIRSVVEENLKLVRHHLWHQPTPGVVTKIHLASKAPTFRLWAEFDQYLRERGQRRDPRYVPMCLPLGATKQSFQRNPVEAYLDQNGKYERTQNADLHHIWPETLGGPTVGWNLVPLPPFQHHDVFHLILDPIVRQSEEGQRFRLV